MEGKKFIILIAAATILILFGAVIGLSASSQSQSQTSVSKNVKATVNDPTSYDWGTIPYSGGVVSKDFTIKNTGTETLKLFNIKTSCHCTKAHLAIDGTASPDFGMDSMSDWTGLVPAGKEARLTVVFDPAFHGPSGIGPINRFVSVQTNSAADTQLTFTLTGTVVNK